MSEEITYSVIMPVYNNIQYTSQAINSVFLHTENFELIVVDNGSHDGTAGYLADVAKRVEPEGRFQVICNTENQGFAKALNQGIALAKGKFIIVLNNDVIVTPKWADLMVRAAETLEGTGKVGKVGIVGPSSNYVARRQNVPNLKYNLTSLDEVAMRFHSANKNNFMSTGYLSGFCMLIDSQLIKEIGTFDERFGLGGFEDNDFVLRALRHGWKAIIAGDTFVHHYGSRTLDMDTFRHMRRGVANRRIFFNKWAEIDHTDQPKKLGAVYRVKNVANKEFFKWSLEKTRTFADFIIVLCDNCDDNTAEIARMYNTIDHPVRVHVIEKTGGVFNERDDRNLLIEKAKEYGADWIISIDADEVFEDKFDKTYVQRLMNPVNPEVACYGFHWYTFFNGTTHWRVDGIFGRMRGWRMFRVNHNDPMQKIILGTEIGLHNGNIAQFPPEQCRWLNVRIKHYGYADPNECERKKQFYENIDQDKQKELIGGDDYSHLTPTRLMVMKWKEQNRLSLAVMVGSDDEEPLLGDLLESWEPFADETVILITNREAKRAETTARLYTNRVYFFNWCNDFSAARNYLIKQCTGEWIATMDPDEALVEYGPVHFTKMMEMDCDGYMFTVHNQQKDGVVSFSEAIRLFRNIPEFTYTGRVHENFDKVLVTGKLRILPSPIRITHYGYLKTDEQVEKKLELYEKLNRLQLQDDPKDARPHFNLALHYRNDGNVDRAKSLLMQAIKLNPKFVNAIKELGYIDVREGLSWFKQALEALPERHQARIPLKNTIDQIEAVVGPEELYVGKAREKMKSRVKASLKPSLPENVVESIVTPGADRDNQVRLSYKESSSPIEV